MRGAADSLSSSAYDGTDAVVTRQDRVQDRRRRLDGPAARRSPPRRSSAGPRGAAGRRRRRRHHRRGADHRPRRQARRRRPVLRRRARRAHARRQRLDAVPARGRPLGDRSGRGRDRRRHGRASSTTRSATASASPPAARRGTFRVVGIARFGDVEVARHRDGRGVRPARPRRRCSTSSGRYDSILVAGRAGTSGGRRAQRRVAAAAGDSAQVQTAAAQDRFTLDGLKQFITIIKVVAARVRRRGDLRRRVHDLQHALDHRRPAHARVRRCCGWSAPRAARCSARCCSRRWPSALLASVVGIAAGFGARQGPERDVRRARASTCPRPARCSRRGR